MVVWRRQHSNCRSTLRDGMSEPLIITDAVCIVDCVCHVL